jgi:hypothetical protein
MNMKMQMKFLVVLAVDAAAAASSPDTVPSGSLGRWSGCGCLADH